MNFCIWVTGLPGSGKSTIVRELEQMYAEAGLDFVTLGLDQIRTFLTPDPAYTDEEREIVYRSLVLMARLLMAHSTKNVIIDATANRRAFRDLARQRIPEFAEIYVKCPLEICRSREASRHGQAVEKNLYRKAENGRLEGKLPGISTPYEEPHNPEVLVPSDILEPRESAKKIMDYVLSRWMH
jgi:adenylylsulfate kinase